VEVVFADREPPGVEAAGGAVVGVVPLPVGVVVLVPAAVVVVVPAPTAAVVVVVLPLDFFFEVLLDPEASACLLEVFFAAFGVDEPQAAAIKPAATTTAVIRSHLARWRGARPGFGLVESVVVCTVVPLIPLLG
jgi:hypothetical protein